MKNKTTPIQKLHQRCNEIQKQCDVLEGRLSEHVDYLKENGREILWQQAKTFFFRRRSKTSEPFALEALKDVGMSLLNSVRGAAVSWAIEKVKDLALGFLKKK